MTGERVRPDGRARELVDLLSLLLPHGPPQTSLVLGSRFGAPGWMGSPEGDAALVMLLPSAAEQRDSRWLEQAVAEVSERLGGKGVVYLLGSPTLRRRLVARLRDLGLSRWDFFLHHPEARTGRHLVPLRKEPLQFAIRHLGAGRWSRRLAAVVVTLPGVAALLGRLAPDAGVLGQREAEEPLASWGAWRDRSPTGCALASGSWEGAAGAVIGRYFPTGSLEPTLVAKYASSEIPARRLAAEASALRTIAREAGTEEVRVPALLEDRAAVSGGMLLQSALPGLPARWELVRAPDRLEPLLRRLIAWLRTWHFRTIREAPDGTAALGDLVLESARRLAPLLDCGVEYLGWLEEQCAAAATAPVPLAAAHQDLTMSNVLYTPHSLGVVDWEAATRTALPFVDLPYAAVDAVMATRPGTGRVEAWEQCYIFRSPAEELVAELWREAWLAAPTAAAVPPLPQLSFHACWLHHAYNEVHSDRSVGGPFLEILRRIAPAPDGWGEIQ